MSIFVFLDKVFVLIKVDNDGFTTQKTDDYIRATGMTIVNDRHKQNHDVTRDIVKDHHPRHQRHEGTIVQIYRPPRWTNARTTLSVVLIPSIQTPIQVLNGSLMATVTNNGLNKLDYPLMTISPRYCNRLHNNPHLNPIKREVKGDSTAVFWVIYINHQTEMHKVRTLLA